MLPVRRWPAVAGTLARTFGVRGAAFRATHELRRATHRFRARPRAGLDLAAVQPDATFRVDPARLRAATDVAAACARADRVCAGEHQAYRWTWRALPLDTGGWLRHPVTQYAFDPETPWWTVRHLDHAVGDIKDLWEPARFAWVYDLVRASLVSGDPRYATTFAARFAGWRRSSPPFRGPHWSCGQETAIRAIALLYAEANLPLGAGATEAVLATLAASGERIDDALGYAISQRNNHAISEASALLAIGVRLRGAHPDAARWITRGQQWLARLIVEQFAADGWYAQHSFTYLRLAMDQCVVAARVLRATGDALPSTARERLRAAITLLLAVVEPTSGEVPNHGANDGAFVHPITLGAYRDFRPLLTAAAATWDVALPENIAVDEEALAWLGLASPTRGPSLGDGLWTGASGWAAARLGATHVFLRAGHYTTRPSHVDPLHVDVRFGAREIVVDAGTFAYNAPPPWRNALAAAVVHNGPLVDARDPGVRGPRFLWYVWPDAAVRSAERTADGVQIVAERAGGLRRTVTVTATDVTVADEVPAGMGAILGVRWLLHPSAPATTVTVDAPTREIHAARDAVEGWFSPGYGVREPSIAIEARVPARDGARLVTTIRPFAPTLA